MIEMAQRITHKAIVTAIGHGAISVSFSPGSQCGGCGIALLCSAKSGSVAMEVPVADPEGFQIGDEVEVSASSRSQWRALLIGLAIPCAVLLCSVMLLLALGVGSTMAAVAGVASIAVYYLILYIFRKKLTGSVRWTVVGGHEM